MGFFRAIGSALGFINNNQTASELAKDISSGVDMMFYTTEEAAIDKAKMTVVAMDSWLRMIETMKGSEAYRSITRRFIAVFIIFNLFCLIWICVWSEIASTFGWFDSLVRLYDPSIAPDVIREALSFTPITWAILKIASVFELGWVFCTIIIFYFGPQLAQILTSRKKI